MVAIKKINNILIFIDLGEFAIVYPSLPDDFLGVFFRLNFVYSIKWNLNKKPEFQQILYPLLIYIFALDFWAYPE